MTLFTFLFLPLLLNLGYWQLDREQQKITAENVYEQRMKDPSVDAATIDWNTNDLNWVSIHATGRFDKERQWLLDNRIHNSVVGYEVVTPFYTDDGILLVNRGWIAQGVSRQHLPSLDVSEDEAVISGHVYVPDGALMVLGEEESNTDIWPKVIQKIDFQNINDVLGERVRPHLIRLDENSTGVLQTNWSAINMRPEVHRAYAVQWFIMALVLFVLYLLFSFKKLER
ncbi:SURF1 family protein [Gammaproteobacteria bacterium LSUCC0112]|nr:SURF1 family protein [Gammaproteobacteria bacterium LSUCC0112]